MEVPSTRLFRESSDEIEETGEGGTVWLMLRVVV
jgi:hypothetical protein